MNTTREIFSTRSFTCRVLEVVARIPEGKTMSYKQVAEAAGNVRAARAVGIIMSKNHDPNVPCHRVIKSDGSLGGYNRGVEQKRLSLQKEGAVVTR